MESTNNTFGTKVFLGFQYLISWIRQNYYVDSKFSMAIGAGIIGLGIILPLIGGLLVVVGAAYGFINFMRFLEDDQLEGEEAQEIIDKETSLREEIANKM
jgi:hypothetical protein